MKIRSLLALVGLAMSFALPTLAQQTNTPDPRIALLGSATTNGRASQRRIVVFDFEVHDGADPGESVGKDPEQSAIAQASVRGCLDRVQKRLN
jgi:hypothetical protein